MRLWIGTRIRKKQSKAVFCCTASFKREFCLFRFIRKFNPDAETWLFTWNRNTHATIRKRQL